MKLSMKKIILSLTGIVAVVGMIALTTNKVVMAATQTTSSVLKFQATLVKPLVIKYYLTGTLTETDTVQFGTVVKGQAYSLTTDVVFTGGFAGNDIQVLLKADPAATAINGPTLIAGGILQMTPNAEAVTASNVLQVQINLDGKGNGVTAFTTTLDTETVGNPSGKYLMSLKASISAAQTGNAGLNAGIYKGSATIEVKTA